MEATLMMRFGELAGKCSRWYRRTFTFRNFQVTPEQADAHVLSGRWDKLSSMEEMGRYSVIIGYYLHYNPHAAILDVGCGEGILLTKLRFCPFSKYVGLDLSSEAIRRASETKIRRSGFVEGDAQTYTPQEHFDIIIFNESLYYFGDPVSVLRRYATFLNENGIIILSMHVKRSHILCLRLIDRSDFKTLDEVKITHRKGLSWIVRVLR